MLSKERIGQIVDYLEEPNNMPEEYYPSFSEIKDLALFAQRVMDPGFVPSSLMLQQAAWLGARCQTLHGNPELTSGEISVIQRGEGYQITPISNAQEEQNNE